MRNNKIELVVLRHGQSDANHRGIISDKNVDHQLTPIGIEQAMKAAEALKQEKLDIIYSSSRQRARLTAETINKYHQLEIIERDDLIERDFGIIGGMPVVEVEPLMNAKGFNWINIPMSESLEQVDSRIKNFLDLLHAQHKNSRILITTHDDIVKSFYRLTKGVSKEDSMLLKIENSIPYYFTY